MRVAGNVRQTQGVDAHNRDNARSVQDQTDGNAQAFDDVLTGVGSDEVPWPDRKTAAMPEPTTALADPALTVPMPTKAAAGTPTSAAPQLLSALIDAFGAGAAATSKAAVTGTAASDDTKVSGSLTKRSAIADDSSASPQATLPNPASDFLSALLAGAGVAPQAAQAAQAAATGGAPQRATADAGRSDPSDTAVAADVPSVPTAVVVSDITVSTHLAPSTAAVKGMATATAAPRVATPEKNFQQDVPKAEPDVSASEVSADAPRKSAASGLEALDASAATQGASLGPVRTIANAIGELAAKPTTSSSSATTAPEVTKPFVSVARTLNLKMSPESLGTVDIRLHVTGQSLDVQLTVSSAQTLGIVDRDRDVLTSALRDQNYQVNSLVIQDGGADASSGGNNATQQGQSGGARPDSSFGGGSSARGGERQGQGAQRSDDEPRRSRSAPAPAPDESGRALFV